MWKLVCGEREETARLFTVPETRSPGTERGRSAQQHCPLLAKQCTICLPQSQVKALLRDTDIFPIRTNATNSNRTQQREGRTSPLCPWARRTWNPEERGLSERLTKKLLDLVCGPVPGTPGLFNPCIDPWQLRAICNGLRMLEDSGHAQIKQEPAPPELRVLPSAGSLQADEVGNREL